MIQKLSRLNFSRWVVEADFPTQLIWVVFVLDFCPQTNNKCITAVMVVKWRALRCQRAASRNYSGEKEDIFSNCLVGLAENCGYYNTSWASVAASLGSIGETTFLHCYIAGKHLLYAKVENVSKFIWCLHFMDPIIFDLTTLWILIGQWRTCL